MEQIDYFFVQFIPKKIQEESDSKVYKWCISMKYKPKNVKTVNVTVNDEKGLIKSQIPRKNIAN